MNEAHYKLKKNPRGFFNVLLIAPNGEPVGTHPKNDMPEEEARAAVAEIQKCSQVISCYQRMKSVTSRKPFFRLWNMTRGEKLLKSESYNSRAGRENGIEACMQYGATEIIIVDL